MKRHEKEPHEPRRGWLKNGNQPGDLSQVPRCGARTRHSSLCQCPAMANGRCRLHGGLSSGPKTEAGIERIRRTATKHGRYTQAAKQARQRLRTMIRDARELLDRIPTILRR
jgi:hypothetical protein